jgi:hypothetical protein
MHLKVFVKLKKTLKTLSSGQKKKKKKTKKPRKTHWAGFKKKRVFSNLELRTSLKSLGFRASKLSEILGFYPWTDR